MSTPASSARESSATTVQTATEIDDLAYGSSNRSSSNGAPWRQVTTTWRSRHELPDRRDLHQPHQVYRYPNQQARKGKGKGDRTMMVCHRCEAVLVRDHRSFSCQLCHRDNNRHLIQPNNKNWMCPACTPPRHYCLYSLLQTQLPSRTLKPSPVTDKVIKPVRDPGRASHSASRTKCPQKAQWKDHSPQRFPTQTDRDGRPRGEGLQWVTFKFEVPESYS